MKYMYLSLPFFVSALFTQIQSQGDEFSASENDLDFYRHGEFYLISN